MPEDPEATIARLQKENAALRASAASGVRLKVSEKGGVSVYGLGRFPVTLYKEQWLRLLGMADQIQDFITDHEAELKVKGTR